MTNTCATCGYWIKTQQHISDDNIYGHCTGSPVPISESKETCPEYYNQKKWDERRLNKYGRL